MRKIIRNINPKNLLTEISLYGYSYSLKRHVTIMLSVIIGIIGLASLLGLTLGQILILLTIVLLFIPKLILNTYREMYEQKKFIDVGNYLEQMLYSFRRKSKIISALEETLILFPDGIMGERIEKTLEHVTILETEGDLYQEAFSIMESEYESDIVKRIHDFMIRVEVSGGEHVDSADILIQDRNKWVGRVLRTQKEKQLVKRNVTIGIVLSLIVVVGTVFMVPSDLVNRETNLLSQISCLVTLGTNFFLWIFVQSKMTGSWIQSEQTVKDEVVMGYYNKLKNPREINKVINNIVVSGIILICGYMVIITNQILWFLVGFIAIYLISSNPKRVYRLNQRNLKREVEKAFPDWMMSLSLLLQTENVQGAIYQSIRYAPNVLKPELEIMQDKIEQQPTSIEPYLEFFEILNIADIQSSMRMLYAMSQSGGEEMSKQINALVERNSDLLDQSEKMKTDDYLAGMSICVLIPMLIGCGKMLVDMGILMYSIMNQTQGFI